MTPERSSEAAEPTKPTDGSAPSGPAVAPVEPTPGNGGATQPAQPTGPPAQVSQQGAAAEGDTKRDGKRRKRHPLRWLVSSPLPLVVLTAVVAAAVGYLLERIIVRGQPNQGWRTGDNALLIVGAVAMVAGICLWGAGQVWAMRRGVFLHAVAESRLTRHAGEDALLRAWVRNQWPRAVVMPYLPVITSAPTTQRPTVAGDGSNIEPDIVWMDAAAELAQRVTDQAATAAVVAPAAEGLSVLTGGQPHLMVASGAMVAQGLAGDDRALRLIADNTDQSRGAFVQYDLATTADAAGPPVATKPVCSAPEHVMLMLPKTSHDLATHATANETHPAWCEEPTARAKRALTEWRSYRNLFVMTRGSAGGTACRWHLVRYPDKIIETPQGYGTVLDDIRSELSGLQGTLYAQGRGPASIMFAAGVLAQRRGHSVGSFPFATSSGYEWARRALTPPIRPALPAPSDSDAHADRTSRARSATRWWRTLVAVSLLAGVAVPFLAGSFAMFLEWVVARSQGGLTRSEWNRGIFWALVVMAVASVMLMLRWVLYRRCLAAPEFRISCADGDGPRLATRHVAIPREVAAAGAQPLADWVTERFCDVITALPDVDDVTVDLRAFDHGQEAVDSFSFGLQKSLRGNSPVVLYPAPRRR